MEHLDNVDSLWIVTIDDAVVAHPKTEQVLPASHPSELPDVDAPSRSQAVQGLPYPGLGGRVESSPLLLGGRRE